MSFEATNLDAMEPAELREWAAALPDTMPGHLRSLLTSYARHKADAMEYRAGGAIVGAIVFERQCDRIYNLLPAECRW
jgi:hypothetical protein